MDAHIDTRGQAKYAHVIVPMCIANYSDWKKNEAEFQEFADKLHGLVIEMQAQHPDGWLIDLRGNGGGNMWPMLAGIGPVVGEGMLGSFENSEGQSDSWFYRAGKAGTRSQDGKEEFDAEVLTPPSVFDNLPWVAVLLDRGTASSGEAVAVSFAGRARERSFGEHTAGFSTSNHMFQLSDGAALFLCTAIEMDRNGKRYQDGIDPDVKLPAPVARPIEGDDSVIQAAINWIASSTKSSR